MVERLSTQPERFTLEQKGLAFPKENFDINNFLRWSGYTQASPTATISFKHLSIAQRSEILWAIYQDCKHQLIKVGGGVEERRGLVSGSHSLGQKLNILQLLWSDEKVRINFLAQYNRHSNEQQLKQQSDYCQYLELNNNILELEKTFDSVVAELFATRQDNTDRFLVLLYQDVKSRLLVHRQQLEQICQNNPEVASLVEFEKLKTYKQQWEKENFIWTDSRRKIMNKLEEKLLVGRPILILSESGAGKTALIEAAALKLTNQPLARSSGGATQRAQDLFATKAIDREGSYWEYQKIMQALSGKQTNRDQNHRHQGQLFLDDEFNTRSTSTQMEIVKSFSLGIKPYKDFQPPNTAIYESIQPYFAYIAAGNPPSHRYDRSTIDVAVEREFSGSIIEIDYLEQSVSNPELFQIMLAALLDENNRLQVAPEEVSPDFICEKSSGTYLLNKDYQAGGFLWRFANCWKEWLKSFSGKSNVLCQKHPTVPEEEFYFSKLILDPGVVLDWIKSYKTTALGSSLETFMTIKIKEFINQPNFIKEDRELAKKFLQLFSINLDDEKPRLPTFKVLTPLEIGFLNPNVPRKKEPVGKIPLPREKIFVLPDGEEISYREDLPLIVIKDHYIGQALVEKESGKIFTIMGIKAENETIFLLGVGGDKGRFIEKDVRFIDHKDLQEKFEILNSQEIKNITSWKRIDELRQVYEHQYDWLLEKPIIDPITGGFWGVINLDSNRYVLVQLDKKGDQLVSYDFSNPINNLSFSPNGQELIFLLGGHTKELKIINRQGKEILSKAFLEFIDAPSFGFAGEEILLQTSNSEIKVFDRNFQELFGHDFNQSVTLPKLSANGHKIVAKVGNNSVVIVDRQTSMVSGIACSEEVAALDISVSGNELLLKVGAKIIDIYSLQSIPAKKISSHRFRKSIYNPQFSPNARAIIVQRGGRKDVAVFEILGEENRVSS